MWIQVRFRSYYWDLNLTLKGLNLLRLYLNYMQEFFIPSLQDRDLTLCLYIVFSHYSYSILYKCQSILYLFVIYPIYLFFYLSYIFDYIFTYYYLNYLVLMTRFLANIRVNKRFVDFKLRRLFFLYRLGFPYSFIDSISALFFQSL